MSAVQNKINDFCPIIDSIISGMRSIHRLTYTSYYITITMEIHVKRFECHILYVNIYQYRLSTVSINSDCGIKVALLKATSPTFNVPPFIYVDHKSTARHDSINRMGASNLS